MASSSTASTILLIFLVTTTRALGTGSSISSLVQIACHRDVTLSFCKSAAVDAPTRALAAPAVTTLSESDRLHLIEMAEAVRRAGGNPFVRTARQGDRKDSDLREKDTENEEGFIAEEDERPLQTGEKHDEHPEDEIEKVVENIGSHQVEPVHTIEEVTLKPGTRDPLTEVATLETLTTTLAPPTTVTEDTEEVGGFKGHKAEYCDNYEQHFSFYCVGEKSEETAGKFCNSYKKACPNKAVTSGSAVTEWPADPFENKKSTKTERVRTREESVETIGDEDSQITEQELYYAELKKRFPCKPDCDPRLFPHCTAECKCDYIYPTVQRFCNPPPMPLFLNTCRLWYHGCPKYDAYHYASQFIYSKAEKGKVLPGFANNVNPYGIPQPTGLRPFQAKGVKTHGEEILYVPPPLPPGYKEKIRRNNRRSERIDVFEEVSRRNKERRKRRRRIATKRAAAASKATTIAPPSARELYRKLKELNALTSDPVNIHKDLLGQGGPDLGSFGGGGGGGGDGGSSRSDTGGRPKARAPGAFPVVPSEAAYGASGGDGDPFQRFSGLTDSRGILHRPRSSSPFTKPGLWAANPDDPHNRDHANRWYYHPRSVGVDWLNGQIQWGAHWAVPAAQVGGTDGFSTVHFPTIGHFLNIPDDYD